MVGFKTWNPVFEDLTKQWRKVWHAGSVIVCDESMIGWEGATSAHLVKIMRKPTSVGFMYKTAACATSYVLLNFEAMEGADIDRLKKWVDKFKATTACTCRLMEPWKGSGRICIADSWFGSTRTVEELAELGLYAVMSIKKGCKDFPKSKVISLMNERGDVAYYKNSFNLGEDGEGEEVTMYAAAHMDKKPLLLCATTGTSH